MLIAVDGERPAPRDDKEFMATLAKGLSVLGCFGKQHPTTTLSAAASAADLSRATARRILRTLAELGYVEQHGRDFALSPNLLKLGFDYLSTQSWIERAQPLMKDLSERLHESCSASILQGTEIVYVARVPTRRIRSATLSLGSRLPAFHTSMGRVQLGCLHDAGNLAAAPLGPARTLYAVDHCRSSGAVRPCARRSRPGLRHRRRRTRARLAFDRGAAGRPARAGGRRAESLDAFDPHHAQRNARYIPARAESGGGADRAGAGLIQHRC
jgi:DNA-binding IclR family transcriptional regulator